jgi:nitrite reductase/ring-hydroxylating ferredoxin subunit
MALMYWVAVATADEIEEEETVEVTMSEEALAVCLTPDGFSFTDDICAQDHAHSADSFAITYRHRRLKAPGSFRRPQG